MRATAILARAAAVATACLLAPVGVQQPVAALEHPTAAPRGASAGSEQRSAGSEQRSAASNRAAARTDASTLLGRLSVPPGSRRSVGEPAGGGAALAQPASRPATPNLIDEHAWWVVPQRPAAVLDSLERHPPAGSRLKLTGTGRAPGRAAWFTRGFAWPPVTSVLASRWLLVELVGLPGGSTGVRADAEVVWITPRAASERIPAGARRLRVSVGHPSARGTPTSITVDRRLGPPFTVTGRTKIRRIVALLNRLPRSQPGASSCAADWGTRVRLAFYRRPHHGRPLAVSVINPSGCLDVQLAIRGRSQPPLAGGWLPGSRLPTQFSLVDSVQSILKVRLHTGAPAGR